MNVEKSDIFLAVPLKTKETALAYVAAEAKRQGFTQDDKAVYQAFLDREAEVSTGLMDGFAIPHAKTVAVDKVGILYVRSQEPLTWETFDEQPVTEMIALLVPKAEEGTEHLQMIADVATALLEESVRQDLKTATTVNEVYQVFQTVEGGK